MKDWNHRPGEIAYLLNAPFCGRILYNTIKVYNEVSKKAFPFPLIYLVLPLILHKATRKLILSKTQMMVWLQRYPELLIGFSERTKQLVTITNEATEFLLQMGLLNLTSNAELEISHTIKSLSKKKYINDEVKDCINKSEHVAKWFAATGKTETIYISLGIKP
ncbi:three component ABC system middle component [Clostridium sp. WILCCON 0269]|uniref:Three component ABC system middle component n=1 Tax=Candidatus Clostridium eludens TaxID=3381663 RepID=A0ABW8SQY3_9CLOT